MRSQLVDGVPMELGAQFLSSHYTVVPRLAREMGLALRPVAPGTAVVRGGALRHFRSDRPHTQMTGGVLPWRSAPRAAAGLVRVASLASGRATSDITAWRDLDDRSGSEWSRRVLGPAVTERLLEPTIHGFYFQSLSDNAAALAAAVSAFGARPGSTLTIDGGLGRLTEALADRLDVRLGRPVLAVARAGRKAVVTTESGDVVADRVIIAVPGAAALAMVSDPTTAERDLMATPYSSGLLVGVPLPRPLHSTQLAASYGVLVHPGERTPIAAVAVASRAHPGTATGDLLTVMLTHESATTLAAADDHRVAATAVAALAELDPTLRSILPTALSGTLVVRHPQAMPTCPLGHSAAVASYRRCRASRPDDPVVLAGDYLGFPWTDSAAATGIWAARAVAGPYAPS
ncbi:oxygen-dependent protoporphyrinogen oxidase [Micromonospora halophytica]|uniref:Oxygen-dependent protoporphyrinogen oxidase n=2 Tax=Micromonospora halophytica TaxID=47864 RepID=A0A1C5IKU0_9ACTN|nr:oxygen-dependent protoporphyrinogen oxidase [Micromonospora halophytica]